MNNRRSLLDDLMEIAGFLLVIYWLFGPRKNQGKFAHKMGYYFGRLVAITCFKDLKHIPIPGDNNGNMALHKPRL